MQFAEQKSKGARSVGHLIEALILILVFFAIVGTVINESAYATANSNASSATVAILGVVVVVFVASFLYGVYKLMLGGSK